VLLRHRFRRVLSVCDPRTGDLLLASEFCVVLVSTLFPQNDVALSFVLSCLLRVQPFNSAEDNGLEFVSLLSLWIVSTSPLFHHDMLLSRPVLPHR
jgi:hypothetical protein